MEQLQVKPLTRLGLVFACRNAAVFVRALGGVEGNKLGRWALEVADSLEKRSLEIEEYPTACD